MSDYTRILLRQGPDRDRKTVILKSGEPAYSTDYKRIVVGDGSTAGGVSIGSKFLGFAEFDSFSDEVFNVQPGYPGDFIFETTSNLLYVLSGTGTVLGKDAYQLKTNYVEINKTPTPDNIHITNNGGTLGLVLDSIDGRYLAGYSIGRGLRKNTVNPAILELSQPSSELSFNGNALQITDGGVSNNKLAPMTPNTVKARLNLSGPPEDITFDELKLALGLIGETGAITLGVPVGTIIDFAGPPGREPSNYLPCDGRELVINEYFELFDAIGNAWGTPTLSTFNLPNLNKRVTIGLGSVSGTGSSDIINESVGSYGGSLSNQLNVKQLPPHVHGIRLNIPGHKHEYTVTIPKFSGVYESGNYITNGFNNYITIIGGNGPDAAPPTTPRGPQDSLTPIRTLAAETIKNNKRYIQQRTIDYVYAAFPNALASTETTSSSALSAKCFRDTGYIVDSIVADILNNANHRSVETGNLYFSGYINSFQNNTTVPSLPANQVEPTIAAIENIGSIIAGYDMYGKPYIDYTNNGVLSALQFFNDTQKVAVSGLRNFTNVIANSAYIPVTSPSGIVPVDANNTFINAASAISIAKPELQQRVVEYVQYNYPYALSGDNVAMADALSARCFRDTGYIIDSLIADIRNNANHRSVETGQFYFNGAVLLRNQITGSNVPTLPAEQVFATIQAISAIGKFINGYVMPLEENYTTNGVLSSDIYFTPSQNIMLSGFNNFTTVITNSANVPVTTPNGDKVGTLSSYDLAADLILSRRSDLQTQTVLYTLYNYPYALSAAAILGVSAVNVTIVNPGSGYTVSPVLVLSGGGSNVTRSAVLEAEIDILTQTITGINVIDAGSGYETFPSITVVPNNLDVIYEDAVLQINSLSEVVPANIVGLSGKCFRDTGFIVDSIAADVRNDANHRSVETGMFYFSGAVLSRNINIGSSVPTLPANEVEPTIQAISAIGRFITGENFPSLPPEYTVIGAPILDIGNGGSERNDSVWFGISAMIYPLQNNGASVSYFPAGSPTENNISLGNLLLQNKTTIQEAVSSYVLAKNYLTIAPSLSSLYTQKCNRDVGYMIDAVANDLITGVNAKSIQYAVAYWDNSTSRLPEDILINQRSNTLDVITYLRSVALGVSVRSSTTLENRIFKKVDNLVSTMIYPLQTNVTAPSGELPEEGDFIPPSLGGIPYQPAGNPTSEALEAATILSNNKDRIQDLVTNYVVFNGYISIDDSVLLQKCNRDVGFMIDAIVNDLVTGVNARSIQYALAYWDGSTSRLPEDRLPQQRLNTIDTIEYLISLVLGYLSEYSGILEQIRRLAGTVSFPLKNNGLLLPYEPQGVSMTQDRDFAYKVLQQNRTRLQEETILFVDRIGIISGRADLRIKCRRDIGYMVDSVINDLIFGTDARSIQYALAYWDGSINRIGGVRSGVNNNVDQVAATIETVRFLRDKCIDLVIESGGGDPGTIDITKTTELSGQIDYNGQTFDGADGSLYGTENEPVGNIQPSAVVNKIIKVR